MHDAEAADVVEVADVRVAERGNRPRLAREAIAEGFGGHLDGDIAAKPWVVRPIDRAHPTLTQEGKDFVRSESITRCQHGRGPLVTAIPEHYRCTCVDIQPERAYARRRNSKQRFECFTQQNVVERLAAGVDARAQRRQ